MKKITPLIYQTTGPKCLPMNCSVRYCREPYFILCADNVVICLQLWLDVVMSDFQQCLSDFVTVGQVINLSGWHYNVVNCLSMPRITPCRVPVMARYGIVFCEFKPGLMFYINYFSAVYIGPCHDGNQLYQ